MCCSAVTYFSVHSEEHHWSFYSIPSEGSLRVSRLPDRLLEHACSTRGEYLPTAVRVTTRDPLWPVKVDCSSVDTAETRVRDTERMMMAALEVVNLRVNYQVDVHSRESSEFYSRHHDAQKDRAVVRAEIEDADDRVMRHIMRIQALEVGARDDTLEDTASRRYRSFVLISYPALIDQGVAAAMAEAEASRIRNGYNNNGTEGVVGSLGCFETKWQYVFSISNCTASCQVKFVTCTLQDDALTWWNSHVNTTIPKAAHAIPWATLKKLMIIITAVRVEDEKTHAYAERQAERKRKYDDLSKNNQNQQQQNKRQNTGQAYTAGNSDRKPYAGSKPRCSKSRPANANNNNRNNNNNNQKGNGCYECGAQGHFKRNYPKLRNDNRGNQVGNDRAPTKVYVLEMHGCNPDKRRVAGFLGSRWIDSDMHSCESQPRLNPLMIGIPPKVTMEIQQFFRSCLGLLSKFIDGLFDKIAKNYDQAHPEEGQVQVGEHQENEMLEECWIETLKFPKAIRTEKVGTNADENPLCVNGRELVPCYGDLRGLSDHATGSLHNFNSYSITIPVSDKEYQDMYELYWLANMKIVMPPMLEVFDPVLRSRLNIKRPSEKVGEVAYKLELPEERNWVDIVGRDEVKRFLKLKRIPLVKVDGNSREVLNLTWECEDLIQEGIPHTSSPRNAPSSSVAS
ncbi:hypothetical protein Tco_0309812 [Tanacetum coccineum]